MAIGAWRRIAAAGLTVAALAPVLLAPAVHAETPRPPRAPRAPVPVREVAVINHSQHPVFQLHVSSSDADQWGDDRLGEATLHQGGTFRVRLGRTGDCLFDIQVVYDDLSHEERRGIDLCRTRAVTFDGSTATAPAELFAMPRSIRLDNRSPRPIRQVFVSSASADQWGNDLAPAGEIPPRTVGGLIYRGGCVADLRVVYDNRAAEERRGIDLCATPTLIIRPGWTTEDAPPAPPPAGTIRLVNRTGRTITALHLRPDVAAALETDDLLGALLLPAGTSLDMPFEPGDRCRFIARAAFGGDQRDLVLPGVELCGEPVIDLMEPPAIR